LADRVRVFATRFNGSIWLDIAYWDSFDGGVTFGSPTAIITASGLGATYGLVDATLYYAKGEARPYKLLFGIRQASGIPNTITLADSTDCESFTVQGTVFTQGADTWQASGIVPSFVFQNGASQWVLLLHTYDSSGNGYAAYATATSSAGPFGSATLIASPYTTQTGTLTGTAGQNTATTNIGTVRLNEPYLVWNGTSQSAEIVTPIGQSGTTLTLDLPLHTSYTTATFAHVAAKHIDPSYAYPAADGSWRGIFTGYGAIAGLTSEYTLQMTASAFAGPWSIASGKLAFSPFGPGSHCVNSTENPSPIVSTTG
jgi:hypothetical protein